jgi:N-acetylated-alpha-linked acidic dipeptidase
LALATGLAAWLGAGAAAQPGQSAARPLFLSPSEWKLQHAFEQALNAVPDPQRLRAWHDMLASEPHVAGTAGDQKVIDVIAAACRDMGLEVQVHEFWPLLSEPVDAKLEIVSSQAPADAEVGHQQSPRGDSPGAPSSRRGVVSLPITEDNLLNDPFIAHPGLSFGWNAYSGSGDVTAGVVYANYGTREDFQTLSERGIDCTGKIILARYGGNFRGYKAKYAEEAGAVGLVIYTDPDDSGYRKGVTYPEGGWANDTCIQRGSIVSLDQPGDPLTPGIAATEHAERLDPNTVGLPRIPVQPIGYRAAQQIMQRMTGLPLPEDLVRSWQGGLACAYRLTGGDGLRLRLMVRQERRIMRTANVIATLRGAAQPEERVLIGSHHDAWGFGAGDPTSGTILVLEAARSFSEMAKRGMRPRRSIDFCFWGAEEFGVIGSTEYCEEHAEALRRSAVAYINLDGATMGAKFSASSDPLLKTLIEQAARDVRQARQPDKSVLDAWLMEQNKERATAGSSRSPSPRSTGGQPQEMLTAPVMATLGGGSDHVGFSCHLGIPSCFISAGGAPGTAYHSNYDNLAWYRRTIGEDYEPALMLARVVNVMTARLANGPVRPFDPSRYAGDLREHLETLAERAEQKQVAIDMTALREAVTRLDLAAVGGMAAMNRALDDDRVTAQQRSTLERCLLDISRAWQPKWPEGLPGRPWFRNTYVSSDPHAGYASWVLPALRGAIEQGDARAVAASTREYVAILDRITETLGQCLAGLDADGNAVGASE